MAEPVLLEDLGTRFATSKSKSRRRYGRYLCRCGKTFEAAIGNVRSGRQVSCGCFRLERLRAAITTHGMTGGPLYETWKSMKSRCYRNGNKEFMNYGGRGISVCDAWMNDFKAFYDWAIEAGGDLPGMSLDRIDVNGNYSPENCRYADTVVQATNRRKQTRNTSGFVGVSYYKKLDRWIAYVTSNGKRKHIGYFGSPEDAAKARDKYVKDNGLIHPASYCPP